MKCREKGYELCGISWLEKRKIPKKSLTVRVLLDIALLHGRHMNTWESQQQRHLQEHISIVLMNSIAARWCGMKRTSSTFSESMRDCLQSRRRDNRRFVRTVEIVTNNSIIVIYSAVRRYDILHHCNHFYHAKIF